MAISESRCSSCGATLAAKGATRFPCPSCGDATLGRCSRCRDQSVPYTCPKCDFHGP